MAKPRKTEPPETMVTPQDILDLASYPKTSRLGKGHVKDTPDLRDRSFGHLLGATTSYPEAFSLEEFYGQVKWQQETEGCVGQALAKAIYMRLKIKGVDCPEPSAEAIWTMARDLEKGKDDPLTNIGCQPRNALKAITTKGIPPESAWPLDMATINEELPWDVVQKASTFKLLGYNRVMSEGAGKLDDICNAISKRYPVAFATDITEDFEKFKGKDVFEFDFTQKRAGGHMLLACGYRTNLAGEKEVRIGNSWDTSWGDYGMAWVNAKFILDPECTDAYIITATGNF